MSAAREAPKQRRLPLLVTVMRNSSDGGEAPGSGEGIPSAPGSGRGASRSRARVYADACSSRPRSYWDYENMQITWGCVALRSTTACRRSPADAPGLRVRRQQHAGQV